MISIISVYNDRNLLERYLLKSLEIQNKDYQLILLDNSFGKFTSASLALNYGGDKAKGDYIMFIHQDYDLISDTWLDDVEKFLNSLENIGVIGVVGRKNRNSISNIKTGAPPFSNGLIQLKEPENVQTVDECLFIVPKEVFEKIQFDEQVCDNWHLYAAEYCLSVKDAGYEVYVIPMGGYHASPGYSFTPEGYYSTLRKLVKKHKSNYKWIYTTTGSWNTVLPLDLQILYQKLYYWLGIDKLIK